MYVWPPNKSTFGVSYIQEEKWHLSLFQEKQKRKKQKNRTFTCLKTLLVGSGLRKQLSFLSDIFQYPWQKRKKQNQRQWYLPRVHYWQLDIVFLERHIHDIPIKMNEKKNFHSQYSPILSCCYAHLKMMLGNGNLATHSNLFAGIHTVWMGVIGY